MKAADLVDAVGVIGVRMGEKHGIHPADPVPERLLPEIDGRVDEQTLAPDLKPGGRSQPLVARMPGPANGAASR